MKGVRMVRLTLSSFVCVLALLPRMAAADLIRVKIEDNAILPIAGGGRLSLDVTFEDPSPVSRMDDLRGYDLFFLLEKVDGGDGKLWFASPYVDKPERFVFTGPRTLFELHDESPSGFEIGIFDPDASGVDITATPVNVARLILEYGPATPPAEYRVRFDSGSQLVNGPLGPDLLFADFTDVGVIRLLPEPGGVSVLLVGGLYALRRRRRT